MPSTGFRRNVKTLSEKKSSRLHGQKAVANIERRYKIMELRRDGWSVGEIAKELKVSDLKVRKDIVFVLSKTIHKTEETAEESRQLQVARLDALLKKYVQLANETVTLYTVGKDGQIKETSKPPDPAYARIVLDIEARRAKLLSLDVPEVKKLEVSGVRQYIGVDMDKV